MAVAAEKAWWDAAGGSPWDVNVTSYTVTAIRNLPDALLAGASHDVSVPVELSLE